MFRPPGLLCIIQWVSFSFSSFMLLESLLQIISSKQWVHEGATHPEDRFTSLKHVSFIWFCLLHINFFYIPNCCKSVRMLKVNIFLIYLFDLIHYLITAMNFLSIVWCKTMHGLSLYFWCYFKGNNILTGSLRDFPRNQSL